jgi:hypothetical protein
MKAETSGLAQAVKHIYMGDMQASTHRQVLEGRKAQAPHAARRKNRAESGASNVRQAGAGKE